jgi:hypothetical protein
MPPRESPSRESIEQPLPRRDLLIGAAILSGLVFVVGLGFAVIVAPALIDTLRAYIPFLAAVGLASTLGGFWYLYWRPR